MALFRSEFNSLDDLFLDQVRDLYDAEQRITEALPKMAEAANSTELRRAFDTHLQETKGHVARLEQIFNLIGADTKRETCQAMKGLLDEGEQMVKAKATADLKDAALIAAAQRVEHYEMAGYGTARTLAQRLGLSAAAELLQQTLSEEKSADQLLTRIAESQVNPRAATA